jgi:hypothetical protein
LGCVTFSDKATLNNREADLLKEPKKDLSFQRHSNLKLKQTMTALRFFIYCLASLLLFSCGKVDQFNQNPELPPLEQGFKSSAAIGYCASIVRSAFNGDALPANITYSQQTKSGFTGAGILHVKVDANNPLPFNHSSGDVAIAALWNGNSGVISILFADIDLLSLTTKFYGLYTVPVFKNVITGELVVIFVEQDIIVGQGQDTLINLSLSKAKFDAILADPVYNSVSHDPFVAVKQNVWHIAVNQNSTPSNFYDDKFNVTGGGQIVEATSNSGGILYHAMIEANFSFANCALNPTSGIAFIQNLKAGTTIDLGNITLDFHANCDGKAKVLAATGKYLGSNGKDVILGWN